MFTEVKKSKNNSKNIHKKGKKLKIHLKKLNKLESDCYQ